MLLQIKLIILFMISTVYAKNDYENKLFPMDLDVMNPSLSVVAKYERNGGGIVVLDIKTEFKDQLRIGNVYDNGILVYPDSDIIIRRRVIKMSPPWTYNPIIQINSIYNNGENQITELVEFIKFDGGYREVVRRPLRLDLSPGARNHPLISMNYSSDDSTSTVTCDIELRNRIWFMIGEIRYGNILIDADVFTPIYKGVTLSTDGKEIIVKVVKMTKNGEHITIKCKILFTDFLNNGICEQIYCERKFIL